MVSAVDLRDGYDGGLGGWSIGAIDLALKMCIRLQEQTRIQL